MIRSVKNRSTHWKTCPSDFVNDKYHTKGHVLEADLRAHEFAHSPEL